MIPVDHRNADTARDLQRVRRVSYAVESAVIGYDGIPPLYQSLEELQQSDESFLAAYDGDVMVGALAFTRGEVLDVSSLTVDPGAFRRGIGARLMKEAEAQGAGCRAITVSTAAANLPAISLYQKSGYAIRRRWSLPDGLALVELTKELAR